MDNKDSNKPQETGGLKLMTVFIAVLALHVVIIGSFTVYHLMSGGGDADLAGVDKAHKDAKPDAALASDGALPDGSQSGDKTAATPPSTETTPSTAAPDVANTPATPTATPAPTTTEVGAASTTAPAVATPIVPAVAANPTVVMPAPASVTPPASMDAGAPAPEVIDNVPGTINGPSVSALAPPPEQSLTLAPPAVPTAPTLAAPMPATPTTGLLAGPVHMPATTGPAGVHDAAAHVHGEVYTVKITDSYKKIAQAHHITVAELKQANHIKGNTLHTGQKLIIPSSTGVLAESAPESAVTHEATPTHTTGAPQPMLMNSVTSTVTPSVSGSHHTYTVVKGDTLIKIAHKFKTTPSAIMEANDITDPTKLAIGKKLHIPASDSRSARVSMPAAAPAAVMPPAAPIEPQIQDTPAPAPAQQPTEDQTDVQPNAQGDLANFTP